MTKKLTVNEAAKAITAFVFRDGPVEDMHANGQLSQADMKRLNKYMVNNLAFVLCLISEGQDDAIKLMAKCYSGDTDQWDDADMAESEKRFDAIREFVQTYANPTTWIKKE